MRSRSGRPIRRTSLSFTSRAARPASRRAPCTSTGLSSRTTSPASSPSTSIHEDVYWCTADPGWVTGTSYGIISPLSNGVTMIVDEADFDARALVRDPRVAKRVSVWYTAPTAIRMMMKTGVELVREHEFPALRFLASVGEPLNPEGVVWGEEAFGLPFHDNWWQTETGGIMIANFAAMDIRPGSMGRPLPGRRGGDRAPARGRRCRRGDASRRGGRARAAARLAVDVPRLPRRAGALRALLRGRLVPDRRPRPPRRGRLLLVRRPRRRRDQELGPPDRAVRGRERPARAPGGRARRA